MFSNHFAARLYKHLITAKVCADRYLNNPVLIREGSLRMW